jgi:uncharacterized membrane-anchored protein
MTVDDQREMTGRAAQWLLWLASGLLVTFFAFGFGAWLSGAASWVGFYAGARGRTLIALAQVATAAGFALGVAMTLAWYWRRCRRGNADISPWAALSACLVLPTGSIFWAIFVDAIAYHYGQDIVRPAFDYAIMYLVLGGVLPLAVGVPWLVSHLQTRARSGGVAREA